MHFPLDDSSRETVQSIFKRKKVPYTEDALIGVLEDGSDADAVYWATIALRDVGTRRCIPALKAKLHYPKYDVQDCSILTVAHLAGADETEFYVAALRDPRTRKAFPMWAIEVAADGRALDAVLEHCGAALSRAARLKTASAGETFKSALCFLARHQDADPRVAEMLGRVEKAWPRLPAELRREIAKKVPRFAGVEPGGER